MLVTGVITVRNLTQNWIGLMIENKLSVECVLDLKHTCSPGKSIDHNYGTNTCPLTFCTENIDITDRLNHR